MHWYRSHVIVHYLQPMKSSQNVILQEFMRLIINNGRGSCEMRLDCPRKYSEGWEGANKQIYFSNETFVK